MNRTVYELLQARADEPQVGRLLQQLDKLSARCSLVAASGRTAAGTLHKGGFQQQANSGGWLHAVMLPNIVTSSRNATAAAAATLPPFSWAQCSEHAALQIAARAVAAAALHADSARAAWMTFVMQPPNIARVLDLAWWTIAAVFKPEDDRSRAVQEHVVAALTRHYLAVMMGRRGVRGDVYLRLWVEATAAAARMLLAAAFPSSAVAGEIGDGLEAQLRRQLRLWSTGSLPGEPAEGCAVSDQEQEDSESTALLHRPLRLLENDGRPPSTAADGEKQESGSSTLMQHDGGVWQSALQTDEQLVAPIAASSTRHMVKVIKPPTVSFPNCRPSPLMARALAEQQIPALHLKAGRRKLEQECVVGSAGGGDGAAARLTGRLSSRLAPAGSGSPSASQSSCTHRAAQCVAAANAATSAYTQRRSRLQQEQLLCKRDWHRERSELAVKAAATAGLGRERRRSVGNVLAGLVNAGGVGAICSGSPNAAATAKAKLAVGGEQQLSAAAASAADTDAQCKASRVQSALEWRGVDWRCEHKYGAWKHGKSLEMAAALMGESRRRGIGGGGDTAGSLARPLGLRLSPASGVRLMKAARRVVEGLQRERAEGMW